MANKISGFKDGNGNKGYHFNCPGCGHTHAVYVEGEGVPIWGFNGNKLKPTFTPSILARWYIGDKSNKRVCHSFVTDGEIRFLDDCTHKLKGQTVPLEDF